MSKKITTSTQRTLLYALMLFGICNLLSSCSKKDYPKGEWTLDCGTVNTVYGDYQMIHTINLDLEKPTIPYEDDINDKTLMTYGTFDFSTHRRVYEGYIDSVWEISKDVYLLHSFDPNWNHESYDSLRYDPENKTLTYVFGSDMLFVPKESDSTATNGYAESRTKENNPLVTWIVIAAVILLILCIGIKFSGEYDGWEFAIPLVAAIAILISIVGYDVVFLGKIPGQLELRPSDGTSALLILFGSMIAVALSYFWGINIIRNGLADEGYFIPIGCAKWVMGLLTLDIFAGMFSDFKIFRNMSSDFIGAITFKADIEQGLLACSIVLAILLTIIQIFQFYKRLDPKIATIASILFLIFVTGGVAMCVSCIPMLVMTIIIFAAGSFLFHAPEKFFDSASESQPTAPSVSNTPQEISFIEPGSIAPTTASRLVGNIYLTSDGRKFKKDGDSVEPYEP